MKSVLLALTWPAVGLGLAATLIWAAGSLAQAPGEVDLSFDPGSAVNGDVP